MGLNNEEIIKSRKEFGSNELSKGKKNSFMKLLWESLSDPIIKILLIALAIKVVFLFKDFDWYETIGILIAVLLASLISSISEYASDKAFERLQEESNKILVKVIRNNLLEEVNIEDIVKGDLIILASGDKVPADGHLISGYLSLDESALNGETKEAKKIPLAYNNIIDKQNSVYRGSVVYNGNAKVIIDNVGDHTIYGGISKELQENNPDSPLKTKLRGLAKIISRIGYLGAILVTLSYLFSQIVINNNYNFELIMKTLTNFPEMMDYLLYALTLSVTIIVVAVPEGLPMMITLVLSSNMKRMLKDNVLVKKLVGIETAGSLNVLLTDKTGTLTKGKLKVTEIVLESGLKITKMSDLNKDKIKNTIYYSLFYNNEAMLSNGSIIGGNSTDKALMEFVLKEDIPKAKIISRDPFSSEKKYSMVTIKNDEERTFIKGAPEVLMAKFNYFITIDGDLKKIETKRYILKQIINLTLKGSRVIVLGEIRDNNYLYIGLVGIKDELRKEAIEGVKLIQEAGIKIIMITGDSKDTAYVMAKDSGIIEKDSDLVYTSSEFNKLSDEDLKKNLYDLKIIARAMPQDKTRLVRIIEEMDLVVGMTGDGVNDAPALKKANVGFAMGSGTEVAKEASDIIILDDNILSISKAILYGRTIFKSIRKFIIYQLTVNTCALFLSIVGSLIGIQNPITIIQMLWLNMIMDTFAGLAFSFEPPLREYMKENPKKKNEPIINHYMYSEVLTSGLYSAILCMLFLKLPFFKLFVRSNSNYLMTAYFALFIFIGIANAFNARTERINIFANLLKNKVFLFIFSFILIVQIYIIYYGGSLFRTYGLTINELIFVFLLSLSVFPVDWIRKYIMKKKHLKIGV